LHAAGMLLLLFAGITEVGSFHRDHEIVINVSETMILPAPFLSVLVNQQNQTGDSHV
jgi:hypothetical protein